MKSLQRAGQRLRRRRPSPGSSPAEIPADSRIIGGYSTAEGALLRSAAATWIPQERLERRHSGGLDCLLRSFFVPPPAGRRRPAPAALVGVLRFQFSKKS